MVFYHFAVGGSDCICGSSSIIIMGYILAATVIGEVITVTVVATFVPK